jgi:hypothetical protein
MEHLDCADVEGIILYISIQTAVKAGVSLVFLLLLTFCVGVWSFTQVKQLKIRLLTHLFVIKRSHPSWTINALKKVEMQRKVCVFS